MAGSGNKAKQANENDKNTFGCFVESVWNNIRQGEFESERWNEDAAEICSKPKQSQDGERSSKG